MNQTPLLLKDSMTTVATIVGYPSITSTKIAPVGRVVVTIPAVPGVDWRLVVLLVRLETHSLVQCQIVVVVVGTFVGMLVGMD